MLGLAASVGVALSVNKASETQAAGETYNYRGTATGWGQGDAVVEGGPAVEFTFAQGEEFKFVIGDQWDKALGGYEYYGTAMNYFAVNAEDNNNIICQHAGTYAVSIKKYAQGDLLFLDFLSGTTFYYAGTESGWADLTSKPISLDGDPVTFDFKKDEQFKVKISGSWDISVGVNGLNSNYYSIFTGDDNIRVNHAGSYDVSNYTENHELKVKIVAHNPSTETVNVLDLFGDLLNVAHHAHYFNVADNVGTNWPGVTMDLVGGTAGIYSVTYWSDFDGIIFNQIGDGDKTGQTMNLSLTGNNGKCLILNHDVDGEYHWNSNNWVSLEAAEFIDGKMHFADIPTSETGSTANCASNYLAAKTAYNALSSDAVRVEVLSDSDVEARLSAWASANHDKLDYAGGVLSAERMPSLDVNTETNNYMWIIVVVSIASLTALGCLLVIKKRKHN